MKQTLNYKDVYQQITDMVIESLENGDIIWQKSWNSFGLPKNISTNRNYRGWNVFWLSFHSRQHEFETPYYITFNQAKALGGSIKKGAKATTITHWATVEIKSQISEIKNKETGEIKKSHPTKLIPITHYVFNIAQTEGIDFPEVDTLYRTNAEQIEACEKVVSEMQNKPQLITAGDKAYYAPIADTVTMPDMRLFLGNEEYYSTLFHELAHSTGHKSRLNREELNSYSAFGAENYSKEELTAEMTATYLSGITNIENKTIKNSTAYIQGWLKALKNDKTLVIKAACQAQKAADYILNIKEKHE